MTRNKVDASKFNPAAQLPYEVRLEDFQMAIQDVYDFFFDVNTHLVAKGLHRLEAMLRPAILSGMLSDMITSSLARHSRSLTENQYHNGHPDLILRGAYPGNSVKAGEHGVEIKTTQKSGGAVDTHGAREQWMCVFVYRTDKLTEGSVEPDPLMITEVYLGHVTRDDFRRNARGELGTRTATLHREGIQKLRENWIYKVESSV